MLYYFLDNHANNFTITVLAINAEGAKESAIATVHVVLHHLITSECMYHSKPIAMHACIAAATTKMLSPTKEVMIYPSQPLQTNTVISGSTSTANSGIHSSIHLHRL